MLSRAVLLLALSGGGVLAQQDEAAPPQDVTAEPPGIAQAAPGTGETANTAAALPRCGALPEAAAGMTDCVLDQAGTNLAFTYVGTVDAARLTLSQSAPEGGERRISDPIRVTGVTQAPRLTDLDGDGSPELFLPVGRVGEETLFELWLPDADFFFVRRDEVIAASPGAIVARDALLVLTSPDPENPDRRVETAMFLDPQGLTELYRLEIDAGAQTCTLLAPTGGATLNAALIEADCADREGFAPPPGPTPQGTDPSPKEI